MIKRYTDEFYDVYEGMIGNEEGEWVRYEDIKHLLEPKESLQDSMKREIERFKNLPEEQAKEEARKTLIAIGYLNEDGSISDNYGKNFGIGNGKPNENDAKCLDCILFESDVCADCIDYEYYDDETK